MDFLAAASFSSYFSDQPSERRPPDQKLVSGRSVCRFVKGAFYGQATRWKIPPLSPPSIKEIKRPPFDFWTKTEGKRCKDEGGEGLLCASLFRKMRNRYFSAMAGENTKFAQFPQGGGGGLCRRRQLPISSISGSTRRKEEEEGSLLTGEEEKAKMDVFLSALLRAPQKRTVFFATAPKPLSCHSS